MKLWEGCWTRYRKAADLTLSGFDQEEFEDLIAEFGTIADMEIEDPVVEDDFDVQSAFDNIQATGLNIEEVRIDGQEID
ncbi:hypothetical protein AB1I68_00695 [Paenibacillus pabuli]|uniref:hypothetical protein n=1 Tax=Paenibacillus pabuli TaxID=1472 RepID=UPI00345B1554